LTFTKEQPLNIFLLFQWITAILAPIAALFELISGIRGCGGFAAATPNPGNSECEKREIALKKFAAL